MFVCQGLIYAKPKNLATLPATQPHPDSLIAVLRRPCKTALPSIHRSPPKLTQLPPPSPSSSRQTAPQASTKAHPAPPQLPFSPSWSPQTPPPQRPTTPTQARPHSLFPVLPRVQAPPASRSPPPPSRPNHRLNPRRNRNPTKHQHDERRPTPRHKHQIKQ